MAAAPGGAQGAERGGTEARGGRAGAGGVSDRKPRPVAVVDEVKPVAADLVGG